MLQQPFSFTTNFSSLLHSPKTSLPYLNDGFNVYELFSGRSRRLLVGRGGRIASIGGYCGVFKAAIQWSAVAKKPQVLRIKEEELQIEEDLMGDFGIFNVVYVAESHPLDDVSSTKIILPASPLGTKKNY
ncbi:UDP-N-acetylmuramyl-tripeptide synthetase 2 [Bienertia sinuspersici]